MKITLDEKACLKDRLTLQEALIAVAASMGGFKDALKNMTARDILDKDTSNLSSEWKTVVSKFTDADEEHLMQLAVKMQECYPKGLKPGTVFYFRSNRREVMQKLKKFFEEYGEYSDEQIINATKKFVASFRGNYSLMPLIKYFISKEKKVMDEDGENHVVKVSELASILENMDDDADIPKIQNSEDWLMNSRN